MRVINFFRNSLGERPVSDFLDSLSAKQAQKITWVMRLVEDLEKVPESYFKKLPSTDGF